MSTSFFSFWGLLSIISVVLPALALLGIAIFSLRQSRFVGSWLLLAGALIGLLLEATVRLAWVLDPSLYSNPSNRWFLVGAGELGPLLSTAFLLTGLVLWILRARSQSQRLEEMERIMQTVESR